MHKGRWSAAVTHYEAHARQMRILPTSLPNYAQAITELGVRLRAAAAGEG